MLTNTFLQLVSRYNPDKTIANNLWLEIFTRYSEPKRHYHTVAHLEHLFLELKPLQPRIVEWDTVLFALFYHDFVYDPKSNSNEADSAAIAALRMSAIGVPPKIVSDCSNMILATKHHVESADPDTNILIDADLCILGASPYEYQRYSEQIRQEFSVYPDFMYLNGRRKVLQHYLDMDHIFKTDYFRVKFEKQARINLSDELQEAAK